MPTTPARRRGQPRTKPEAERRRDLLDAGLAVFTRRGVGAATVDDIASEAGVAKGTFYLYFSSKEHLLSALQRDFEETLVARVDAAVATAGQDWADRLDAWVRAVFADHPTSRQLHDVLYHHAVDSPASPSGAPADPPHDLVASLTRLLTAGIAAGAYDVEEPELTALLLCSALHRTFDRVWHRADLDDTPRLVTAVDRLFHRAVGIPETVTGRT